MTTFGPDFLATQIALEREKVNGHRPPMADDERSTPVPVVVWSQAFHRPPVDAMVDGFLFPGRWTADIGPPKVGKSDLSIHVAHSLARGRDPFSGDHREAVDVLYLDGEMGEPDMIERLIALNLAPVDLSRLHYTDLVPKGDTVQGGAAIVSTAKLLDAKLVIFDGLNAFVTGAEKDDLPWRNLFEHTIAPLKRAGIALLSSDNTGKDLTLGSRGSSVKLDKADAIVMLKRTDNGVNLKATHQRTSNYARSIDLDMTGANGDTPINYRQVHGSWPAGTKAAADLLDRLGVSVDDGREKARAALQMAGERLSNDVLSAAIRHRRSAQIRPVMP